MQGELMAVDHQPILLTDGMVHLTVQDVYKRQDYDPANPDMEQALRALLTGIQPRDRIYLDVTGGPRNVSFLMLLLTRALSYKNCSVEQVVYLSLIHI